MKLSSKSLCSFEVTACVLIFILGPSISSLKVSKNALHKKFKNRANYFTARHELWCICVGENNIRRHNINYMARFSFLVSTSWCFSPSESFLCIFEKLLMNFSDGNCFANRGKMFFSPQLFSHIHELGIWSEKFRVYL